MATYFYYLPYPFFVSFVLRRSIGRACWSNDLLEVSGKKWRRWKNDNIFRLQPIHYHFIWNKCLHFQTFKFREHRQLFLTSMHTLFKENDSFIWRKMIWNKKKEMKEDQKQRKNESEEVGSWWKMGKWWMRKWWMKKWWMGKDRQDENDEWHLLTFKDVSLSHSLILRPEGDERKIRCERLIPCWGYQIEAGKLEEETKERNNEMKKKNDWNTYKTSRIHLNGEWMNQVK